MNQLKTVTDRGFQASTFCEFARIESTLNEDLTEIFTDIEPVLNEPEPELNHAEPTQVQTSLKFPATRSQVAREIGVSASMITRYVAGLANIQGLDVITRDGKITENGFNEIVKLRSSDLTISEYLKTLQEESKETTEAVTAIVVKDDFSALGEIAQDNSAMAANYLESAITLLGNLDAAFNILAQHQIEKAKAQGYLVGAQQMRAFAQGMALAQNEILAQQGGESK